MCNTFFKICFKIDVRLVEDTTYVGFRSRDSMPYDHILNNRLIDASQKLHVAPSSEYTYSQAIVIPQFTPTHNTCPYIQVKYYVKVLISNSSFFGTKLSLKIPIVIGTVPYEVSFSRLLNSFSQ
ncbi:hypothetical protein PENTCL1PPCAC_14186, partial [Pristionchus entomophagus]